MAKSDDLAVRPVRIDKALPRFWGVDELYQSMEAARKIGPSEDIKITIERDSGHSEPTYLVTVSCGKMSNHRLMRGTEIDKFFVQKDIGKPAITKTPVDVDKKYSTLSLPLTDLWNFKGSSLEIVMKKIDFFGFRGFDAPTSVGERNSTVDRLNKKMQITWFQGKTKQGEMGYNGRYAFSPFNAVNLDLRQKEDKKPDRAIARN